MSHASNIQAQGNCSRNIPPVPPASAGRTGQSWVTVSFMTFQECHPIGGLKCHAMHCTQPDGRWRRSMPPSRGGLADYLMQIGLQGTHNHLSERPLFSACGINCLNWSDSHWWTYEAAFYWIGLVVQTTSILIALTGRCSLGSQTKVLLIKRSSASSRGLLGLHILPTYLGLHAFLISASQIVSTLEHLSL